MKVIDYGCTITSLKVPDSQGQFRDIVLGFDSLNGYLSSPHYMGCVIGRYANRIANGSFNLEGHRYTLAKNQAHHHLHGGIRGFDKVVWKAEMFQNEDGHGIEFHYKSPDGEEGYPGNVYAITRYYFNQAGDTVIHYIATTDRATIVNLTQHSYFNLSGETGSISEHLLMINADCFLPIDHTMIPAGELRPVEGSLFDFRTLKSIGNNIQQDDPQLQIAHGYDHNFVLNQHENEFIHAATLYEPACGLMMEVHTTEPGIQLYTGNSLDDSVIGKNNARYTPHSGLCLETQHFPNSPNQPEFPSVILKPGEQFRSTTIWKFSSQ